MIKTEKFYINIVSLSFKFQGLVTEDLKWTVLKEKFTRFSEKHSCVVFCSFPLSHFKPQALCSKTTTPSFTVISIIHFGNPNLRPLVLLCFGRRCCEETGMDNRGSQAGPGVSDFSGGGELAKKQRTVGFIN